jgi:uncharacterized membrane protein YkvA (DUF1232 family)
VVSRQQRTTEPRSVFKKIGTYARLLFSRNTGWQVKAMLAAALVYLVSPFDLLPDWLLGFGIIDDVGVVSLLVWLALRIIEKDKAGSDDRQIS